MGDRAIDPQEMGDESLGKVVEVIADSFMDGAAIRREAVREAGRRLQARGICGNWTAAGKRCVREPGHSGRHSDGRHVWDGGTAPEPTPEDVPYAGHHGPEDCYGECAEHRRERDGRHTIRTEDLPEMARKGLERLATPEEREGGERLRSCPFCGDEHPGTRTKKRSGEWVSCGACGGRAPMDVWQERPTPEGEPRKLWLCLRCDWRGRCRDLSRSGDGIDPSCPTCGSTDVQPPEEWDPDVTFGFRPTPEGEPVAHLEECSECGWKAGAKISGGIYHGGGCPNCHGNMRLTPLDRRHPRTDHPEEGPTHATDDAETHDTPPDRPERGLVARIVHLAYEAQKAEHEARSSDRMGALEELGRLFRDHPVRDLLRYAHDGERGLVEVVERYADGLDEQADVVDVRPGEAEADVDYCDCGLAAGYREVATRLRKLLRHLRDDGSWGGDED